MLTVFHNKCFCQSVAGNHQDDKERQQEVLQQMLKIYPWRQSRATHANSQSREILSTMWTNFREK